MQHVLDTLSATNPLISARSFAKRTPVVFQSEAAECGLACLCMIARRFGDGRSLLELRQRFGLSLKGATLKNLIDVAGELALSARPLKLEMTHLNQLQLPCILHWDMQHFVVLTKVGRSAIHIHDPAQGKRKLTLQEAGNHFTGIAMEVWPSASFAPAKPSPTLSLIQLCRGMSGLRRTLLLTFILTLLLQVFVIVSPYYMQTIIDDVLPSHSSDLLAVLALGFALLLCVETLTLTVRKQIMLHLTSRLQVVMSTRIFHHLIRLPLKWFATRHTGDVISRFGSLSTIREVIASGLITAILDGVMAVITFIVLIIYAPTLALVVLAVSALYAGIRVLSYFFVTPHHRERLAVAAKEQSHFIETTRAIQTIRQFRLEAGRQAQWQNRLTDTVNADICIGKWEIRTHVMQHFLSSAENLLVIFLAAKAVMAGNMTIGMLYAFISYKNRFTSAIDSLIIKIIEFCMLKLHLDRLSDIALSPRENDQPKQDAHPALNAESASLKAKSISYAHDSHSSALFQSISVTIPQGECVAIIGASGSGKSTLLKCLSGLYLPTGGEITFNGQSVNNLQFRQSCAAVFQDDALLSGSIIDNICGFSDAPDLNRAVATAQLACIHQDIIAMPMQYNTLVGDMGSALSGGQIQRIMLARALYQRPTILFLDEASSHLDIENEAKINANLRQLQMTRVMVAHRPQTIAMADRVYCLKDGQLTLVKQIQTECPDKEK